MLAELCFHLARRLNAGDSARECLIDRGIELSTVTSKHVKASNRKVKHILAYQAHKDIHKNLLVFANEELAVNRSIIYDESNTERERRTTNRRHSMNSLKSSAKSTASTLAFAHRCNFREDRWCLPLAEVLYPGQLPPFFTAPAA